MTLPETTREPVVNPVHLGGVTLSFNREPSLHTVVNYPVLYLGVRAGTVGYGCYRNKVWMHIVILEGAWRRKGFGTRAAHQLFDRLKEIGATEVHALIRPGNPAALALANKLGFTVREEVEDSVVMAVNLLARSSAK